MFKMFDEKYDNYNVISKMVLKGTLDESSLSTAFFSKENIEHVQILIKNCVFKASNGGIILEVDQDLTDLIILMRSVYFEYGKFLPLNINDQVKELNKLVLKNIVPNMITEIKQNQEYLRVIESPLVPIPLPLNLNDGKRSLPSLDFLK